MTYPNVSNPALGGDDAVDVLTEHLLTLLTPAVRQIAKEHYDSLGNYREMLIADVATADAREFMFIEDVSELTTIPTGTLRFWRTKAGGRQGPPSTKFGRRIVYRTRDVHAWMNAQWKDPR